MDKVVKGRKVKEIPKERDAGGGQRVLKKMIERVGEKGERKIKEETEEKGR